MEEVPDFDYGNDSGNAPVDNDPMDPGAVEEDAENTMEGVMDDLINTPGQPEEVQQFAQMILSSQRTNRSLQGFMQESMGTFAHINANLQMISDRLSSNNNSAQVFTPTPTSMQQEFQMEASDPGFTSPSFSSMDTNRMSNVTGRNTTRRSRIPTMPQSTNRPSASRQSMMQQQPMQSSENAPRYILQNRMEPTLTPLHQSRRSSQTSRQSTRYSDIPIIPQESINIPYDRYSRQPSSTIPSRVPGQSASRFSSPPATAPTPISAPPSASVPTPAPNNPSVSTPTRYNMHMDPSEPPIIDTTYRRVYREPDQEIRAR